MSVAELLTEKPMANAKAIPLGLIESHRQCREYFDEPGLRLLGQCMLDDGQIQPILVRWDNVHKKYVIVAGERRYRASIIAGLEYLYCIVQDGELDEAEILFKQIVENEHRESLKPSEKAKSFALAVQLKGFSGKQLAERLSISTSNVSRALGFLDLPADLQDKVDAGEISLVNALRLCRQKRKPNAKANTVKPAKDCKSKKLKTSLGITVTLQSRKPLHDPNIILALRELLESIQAAAETQAVAT